VERLWRTVKYEEVYFKDYTTVREARQGLAQYCMFDNHERLHQALSYQTPAAVYHWQGVSKETDLTYAMLILVLTMGYTSACRITKGEREDHLNRAGVNI